MIRLFPGPTARADRRPLAAILGTNEIASAVAVHLHRAGHAAVLADDPQRPVIRRAMAFHDSLYGETAVVEGVAGIAVESLLDVLRVTAEGNGVAVTRLGLVDLLPLAPFAAVIDARMLKHAVIPDLRGLAAITIGLGPGFAVGLNCDAAIETRPGEVGRVGRAGVTAAADGRPALLGGYGRERFVRSETGGRWRTAHAIGSRVFRGMTIGHLDGRAVATPLDGVIRGLVRDGLEVPAGVKLLEIDPRNRFQARWTGIDDRGAAIAEATAEVVVAATARSSIGV